MRAIPAIAMVFFLALAGAASAQLTVTVDEDVFLEADAAVDQALEPFIQEVEGLAEDLRQLQDLGRPESEVEEGRKRLAHAEGELDRERIRVLAKHAGVSEHEVAAMRESGMGWGQIAKSLGVHPGVLGVGNKNTIPPGQAKKLEGQSDSPGNSQGNGQGNAQGNGQGNGKNKKPKKNK